MDLRAKMQQNARKNIFTEKQTIKKLPLMFLHINLLMER